MMRQALVVCILALIKLRIVANAVDRVRCHSREPNALELFLLLDDSPSSPPAQTFLR